MFASTHLVSKTEGKKLVTNGIFNLFVKNEIELNLPNESVYARVVNIHIEIASTLRVNIHFFLTIQKHKKMNQQLKMMMRDRI